MVFVLLCGQCCGQHGVLAVLWPTSHGFCTWSAEIVESLTACPVRGVRGAWWQLWCSCCSKANVALWPMVNMVLCDQHGETMGDTDELLNPIRFVYLYMI